MKTCGAAIVTGIIENCEATIFAHDVKHGRAKVGSHHRTLREFSAALARFGGVVASGAKELRRRGHRDSLKASAYAHTVKGRGRTS